MPESVGEGMDLDTYKLLVVNYFHAARGFAVHPKDDDFLKSRMNEIVINEFNKFADVPNYNLDMMI